MEAEKIDEIGKDFHLVFSLLMLILVTDNRTIVLDDGYVLDGYHFVEEQP